MIERLREVDSLRREAATYCERWYAVGCEIFDENHRYMGRFETTALADHISRLHNQFLPICALLFQACKKHIDRLRMKEEQDAGQ